MTTHKTSYLIRVNGAAGLAVAVLLAFSYALWLFPVDFFTGEHPYWHVQNQDVTVYLSGFHAFFREPWQFPWLKIASINWPEGTRATFLDIIPLYALILKGLLPADWFPFNPFGGWVLICLLLQAAGVWWILRESRLDSWPVLIGLSVLLLTFPAWLARQGHISLLSHWILIFGFALTIRSRRLGRLSLWGWSFLLLPAFFINIYLDVMAWALFSADLLRNLRSGVWMRALGGTCALLLLLCSISFLSLWPLPAETGAPDEGYGIYSMNLLSPLSGSRWFDLPAASQNQGFEGFNYLGLGGWCLMLLAIKGKGNSRAKHYPDSHPGGELVGVLMFLALYALSNKIYFGSSLVATYDVPAWAEPMTGQFRASGRFFWPVGYALLIFSVLSLAQRLPARRMTSILVVTLSLQMADQWPRLMLVSRLVPDSSGQVIRFSDWDAVLPKQTRSLLFFPKFRCSQSTDPLNTVLPVMRYASDRSMNLNTSYVARYRPVCGKETEEISQTPHGQTAYVFVTQEYATSVILGFFPKDWPMVCQPVDFATVCYRSRFP